MTTFKGAVVGADPARTGPRGRARCRKESDSAMVLGLKGAGVNDEALFETGVLLLSPCLEWSFLFDPNLPARWTSAAEVLLRGSNCVCAPDFALR